MVSIGTTNLYNNLNQAIDGLINRAIEILDNPEAALLLDEYIEKEKKLSVNNMYFFINYFF